MHTDRFLLIVSVFVWLILCLVRVCLFHSLSGSCSAKGRQSQSNGLAGPNDYEISDW